MKVIAMATLAVYVASIHLETYVPIEGLGSIPRIIGIVAFFVCSAYVIIRKRILRPEITHVLLFVFFCMNLVSILWSLDPESTLVRTTNYLMQLGSVWLIWQLVETEGTLQLTEAAYVLGALAVAAANVVAYRHGNAVAANSGRFAATGNDPNEFALSLALAIPLAWHLSISLRSKLLSAFFRLSPLVLLVGILLTGSRGGSLAAVASLLVIPLCRKQVNMVTKVAVIGMLVAAVTIGTTLIPEDTMKRLLSIGTQVANDQMAGRGDLWAAGWIQFKAHPFIGVGAGAFPVAISVAATTLMVAHNTYLSILTELGCVGFTIFLCVLFSLFYFTMKMRAPERGVWFAMLACWAVGVASLTWEYSKPTWLLFALIPAQWTICREELQLEDESEEEPEFAAVGARA